jgi:hypothetical protein
MFLEALFWDFLGAWNFFEFWFFIIVICDFSQQDCLRDPGLGGRFNENPRSCCRNPWFFVSPKLSGLVHGLSFLLCSLICL